MPTWEASSVVRSGRTRPSFTLLRLPGTPGVTKHQITFATDRYLSSSPLGLNLTRSDCVFFRH
ncbi:hypothetical protein INR49_007998 [Caranx melampygus]|nr:hypothetical protein INR49_007998 [Caranx melampygus]